MLFDTSQVTVEMGSLHNTDVGYEILENCFSPKRATPLPSSEISTPRILKDHKNFLGESYVSQLRTGLVKVTALMMFDNLQIAHSMTLN